MAVANRKERRRRDRLSAKGARPARKIPAELARMDAVLAQALALYRKARYSEALQHCQRVLAAQPARPEALNFAGVLHLRLGQATEAVTKLRAAIARRPGYAEAYSNLGNALQAMGKLDAAADAYRQAVELKPDYAEAYYNLGIVQRARSRVEDALAAHRRAIELNPDFAEAHSTLGHVLQEVGRSEEAVAACRRAVQIRPDYADGYNNLALALGSGGQRDAAIAALERAIEINPKLAQAHCNLGEYLYRERDPEPAAQAFARALDADPGLGLAHFFLGIMRDQQGNHDASERHFREFSRHNKASRSHLDAWSYVKSHAGKTTRFHSDSFETLKFALDQARVEGLVVEFGVRFGHSINFLAQNIDQKVYGFDSFEGLPESWEGFQRGVFTTKGVLPDVAPNVRLHAGWFADTLPHFAAEHPGPVRFMNVDCDIYRSTKTIFEHLADRIVPGTVIVFDEYIFNPNWRHDEYKAFQEAVRENSWRYEYIAFNLFSKQAAVRII